MDPGRREREDRARWVCEGAAGVATLVTKYPQYQVKPQPGPVVIIAVEGWSSWSAR